MRHVTWMAAVVVMCGVTWAAEPDASTPQGAQKAARQASEKGDSAALRKLLHATNPTEEKLADAIAENSVAGASAYKAAVARFGEAETRKTLEGVVPMQPTDAEDEKTKWKIEGDKATIVPTDKNKPAASVALIKVDGAWKMGMSEIVGGRPAEEIDPMVTLLKKQADLMKEAARETGDGKYASASDLRLAVLDKTQKMTREIIGPATQASEKAGK